MFSTFSKRFMGRENCCCKVFCGHQSCDAIQGYQFCPSVPQATFLDWEGGFLNFTDILGCLHDAAGMSLPQL